MGDLDPVFPDQNFGHFLDDIAKGFDFGFFSGDSNDGDDFIIEEDRQIDAFAGAFKLVVVLDGQGFFHPSRFEGARMTGAYPDFIGTGDNGAGGVE